MGVQKRVKIHCIRGRKSCRPPKTRNQRRSPARGEKERVAGLLTVQKCKFWGGTSRGWLRILKMTQGRKKDLPPTRGRTPRQKGGSNKRRREKTNFNEDTNSDRRRGNPAREILREEKRQHQLGNKEKKSPPQEKKIDHRHDGKKHRNEG